MYVRYYLFAYLFFICITSEVMGQSSVFELFKSDVELAHEHFTKGNYQTALDLYLKAADEHSATPAITQNMARCYFFLKQYEQAVTAYEQYMQDGQESGTDDLYYFAEAHLALGHYGKAEELYKQYLEHHPGDELIYKKIWRIDNLQYLYEDSLHYAVRPISLNTTYGELCPVSYNAGIVFMSNREKIGGVEQINPALNTPFYHVYYASTYPDTVMTSGTLLYEKPVLLDKAFNTRLNTGPVCFYQHGYKMVFAVSGKDRAADKTLQLLFAERNNDDWKITASFPFNSTEYSMSDPAINEEGDLLFFSSDMPGGAGGKDIYRSELINGTWSKPVNLGEEINTRGDEVFPYLHHGEVLYFSSNGQPGLGGLDIFKAEIFEGAFGEVQNMGYPLNSNGDDFGIVIDSMNTHGYLTSNRNHGGYDDDIYEFDMDIQTYPLQIAGVMKYIEHSWADSADLKVLPHVEFTLIDNLRNVTVASGTSDQSGNFTMTVPYFSKYRLYISGGDIGEGIVSFEVPKYRKLNGKYEVVVVKDDFRPKKIPMEDENK